MKVLHVLYSGLGGHGNVFFSTVEADKSGLFEYEALFNGVEEVRTEYIQRCTRNKVKWYYVSKTPGLDFGYYLQLYKKIRHSNPDVIMLHGCAVILPAFVGKMFSKKKVRIVCRETQANHLKTKMNWIWLGVALLLADRVVYLSSLYMQQIRDRFGFLFKESKSSLIPNGIDLDVFKPIKKGDDQILVLGMLSRIVKIKDHQTVLDALKILKTTHPSLNFKFKIAGDGEHRSFLEKYTQEVGLTLQVDFVGKLDEADLVAFVQSLDIYIHASFGETMSTAIMQAMACELPIIASDVDGINNMITHSKTGLLVPIQNSPIMAQAILELCAGKDFAKELASNARSFAKEHYSSEVMFTRYAEIFNALNN